MNEGLALLESQLDEFFDRLGTPQSARRKEFFVEARYPYQVWELEVPLAKSRFDGEGDVAAMVESFHDVHERVFAVKEPGQYVECVYWKARAIAALSKPELRQLDLNGGGPAHDRRRRAWLGIEGGTEVQIFFGSSLSGERVDGPAIVEEPTTTIVVYPGWTLSVTASRDYLLEANGGRRDGGAP